MWHVFINVRPCNENQSMYVRMYVCTYVCMYMYVYVCIIHYIRPHITFTLVICFLHFIQKTFFTSKRYSHFTVEKYIINKLNEVQL